MIEPMAAMALFRFAHDASAMLLWGAFAFLAILVPPRLGRDVERRLGTFRVVASLIAATTGICTLPLEAAAIGDGWGEAVDPATLRAVLFDTSVGRAWQIECGAVVLLAASLAVPFRWKAGATAAAAALLLLCLTLTGHAAMHTGWFRIAHVCSDGLHVLAGGAWFGALVPLKIVIGYLGQERYRSEAILALRRFSAAGHGAVALVVASGAANMALVLERWPAGRASPYQSLLTLKIVVVAVMIVLAAINRYAVVPHAAAQPVRAFRLVRWIVFTELALAIVVVGLVPSSVFGLLDPV